MRRSKLFRIAGAVFGLTLAACGSEVEGQAPDSDTTQDTSNEVNDTEPDTQPDTEPDTTPDTDTAEDTDTAVDTDTTEDTDTADTDTAEDTDTAVDTDTAEDTDTAVDTDTAEDTDTATDTDTVTPPSGESCSDPRVVVVPSPFAAPIVATGDTTGKADDHSVDASACLGMDFAEGEGAPDEAWSFTAPTAGVYRISALSGSGDVGFYVLETCGVDAACLGGSDFEGVGAANLDTRLYRMNAGQTVFIVVDGFEPTNAGTYTLTIDPPAAFVPGDVCEDAIDLTLDETGAWSATGDTSTTTFVTDNYEVGLCGPDFAYTGTASPDMVFEFVAPTAGTWTATLTPETGVDLMMYAYLGANCGQTCAGAVDDGFSGEAEELVLDDLQAGDIVRFVVDSWIPTSAGAFTLSVSSVCTPSCDLDTCGNSDGCGGVCGCGVGEGCLAGTCAPAGETCADPIPLTAGPDNSWTGAGNLTGRVNNVSGYTTTLGCGVTGFSSNGNRPDETFSFTPTTTGPYVVSVTAIGAATDVLFAVFTGPGCATGSCLTFTDNNPEGTFTDTNTLQLTAGTAYTIVVDSFSDSALGAYTVNVAPQCQPFCAEGACNVSDGCGGTCGCDDGEQCNASNTCEPIPLPAGETCNNPVAMTFETVGTVPTWTGAGTLVGRTADVPFTATCANLGTGTPSANTVEQTFSFTTTTAGLYTVTLTSASARDIWMHLYTGPGCAAASCIGYFDTETSDPEILTLTLPADTQVTLVVEPWSTFTTLDAFTLKVTKDCDPSCTTGCGVADGCGGTCGCGVGQTCNQPAAPEAGTCDNIPGETCAAPLPLVAGANETWSGSGNLTGNVDAHSRGSCTQLGTGSPTGTGAADEFWSFTPTTTGLHKIDLTRGTVGDVWFAIYEGSGCTNSGATSNCRGYYQRETGTAVETLTLSLTAGTNYTIVVEPSSSFTTLGTYTLGVSKVCDPVCTPGVCGGDNSCGGTCGCLSGETCTSGVCVATPGDACAAPFTSNAANFTTTVNTCTMANNFTVSNETGGCQSSTSTTANTRDFVVAYTPPITGQYRVNSTQSPDLVVNVVTGACPTAAFGTCLAGADDPASLTFNGVAGETVYVIVDQYGTPCAAPTDVQNTTLTIDYVCNRTPGICDGQLCNALDNCGQPCGCTAGQNCNTDGTCGERLGNSCNAPLVVNAETFTTTVNTCNFENNFSVTSETAGCQSNTSTAGTVHRDFVVAFTPPTSGRYTAASTQGPDLIVNVVSGACPAATFGTCLAGGDTPASATFDAVGGQTYHIVVDQWANACSSSTTQDTTFTITKQCLPDCTGKTCDQDNGCGTLCGCPTGGICTGNVCEAAVADSCANPGSFTLANGIYTATGDIRGAGVVDNFRANTCPPFVADGYVPGATTASRDQVFAFTAPSTGEFDITLDPGTATDIYFQVLSGAACADATCTGVMDEGGSGANEAASVDMVAGTTYWIVVDSWSATSTAPHPFTLTIEGLCTPGPNECTGQACSFVTSCGTPCGCADGLVCTNDVCGAAPYDVCSSAGTLAENTVITVDTCTLESDYDLDTPSTCAAPSTGAPDAVFGFTAPTAGEYAFTVTGDATMDIVLNTVTEATCQTTIATCSESADDVLDGEPEVLRLNMTAGQTTWLYVSGYAFFGSTDCGEVDVLVNKVQAEVCTDDVDNDLNGDIDCDDTACASDPACAACVPTNPCQAGECNRTDSCGNVCSCQAGQTCNASNTCEAIPVGESCANPAALPSTAENVWSATGTTIGKADNHAVGTCPQLGFESNGGGFPDEAWRFTTTVAGNYRIDLNRTSASGDIFFYVFSANDCAAASCLGYVDRVASGTETQNFVFAANTTYTIVVDSFSATSAAAYTLTATYLPPVPGDTCSTAIDITTETFSGSYNLCNYANELRATSGSGCAANTSTTTANSRDIVFRFVAPANGTYDAVVTETTSFDSIINVVSGTCPSTNPYTQCIAGSDTPPSTNFVAVAGQEYFIIVDAYNTGCNNFTFNLTKRCEPTPESVCQPGQCDRSDSCGTVCGCTAGNVCNTTTDTCEPVPGDSCAAPVAITTETFNGTYDLCTFANNFRATSGGGCAANTSTTTTNHRDVVFAFTPPSNGTYDFVVTETGSFDSIINIVSATCPTTQPYSTCLAGSDTPPSATLTNAVAGQTYYVIVDAYSTGCNNFSLAMTKRCVPTPESACQAGQCDRSDSCGTPCACQAGQTCNTTTDTCENTAPVGDTCANPYIETTQTWTRTVDTCTMTNNIYSVAGTGCRATSSSTSPGRDVFVQFTAPTTGIYTVSYTQPPDLVANVIAGNTCPTAPINLCVASADDTPTSATFSATAGQTFIIAVDAYNDACGSTTISMAFSEPGPADSCANAGSLTAGTGDVIWTGSGDTAPANVLNDFNTTGCAAIDGTTVPAATQTAKDQVWAFTVPTDGAYRVLVSSTADLYWTLRSGASCSASTCLGSYNRATTGTATNPALEGAIMNLTAGTNYFLVVDGSSSASGAYTILIDRPVSDTCAPPVAQLRPAADGSVTTVNGSTAGLGSNFGTTGCTAASGSTIPTSQSRDLVYDLVVTETANYRVQLNSQVNKFFYLLTGAECGTATCSTLVSANSSSGFETGTFALTAGTQYWLVVDTAVAAPGSGGNFSLSVAKAPIPFDTCAVPATAALNTGRTINTCNLMARDFTITTASGCTNNNSAPEGVATFTAPQAGAYRFALAGASPIDPVINIVRAAACPAGPSLTCNASTDAGGAGTTEAVTLTLTEGEVVWAFMSGYGTVNCGNVTLTVTANFEVCTDGVDNDNANGVDCADPTCSTHPSCQVVVPVNGDSCANPIALQADAGGWTSLGNLTGTADDFSDYDTCALLGGSLDPEAELDGQPDQVFSFTVPTDGRYTIEVLPGATDDLIWALYSGATCADATCIGYTDLGLTGDDEIFTLPLTAGTNYYLVIDTFSDAPYEEFGVFVEGCVPTVACDGTTCGTDSCGTPCTCNAGTTCNDVTDVCEAAACNATDLFISEYIEGASNDKAIEIYNGTTATIDLADYQIWRANNGAPATWPEITAANRFNFTTGATLAPGDVWVICNSSAQTNLRTNCDQLVGTGVVTFNGNDFVGLVKIGAENVLLDAVGVTAPDPGASGWPVGVAPTAGTTTDHVLIRKSTIKSGTSDWAAGAPQWNAFAASAATVLTANTLGTHAIICE